MLSILFTIYLIFCTLFVVVLVTSSCIYNILPRRILKYTIIFFPAVIIVVILGFIGLTLSYYLEGK